MTQVNLLPPEVRREQRSFRAAGRIRRASLIGLLLLGGLYGIRTFEVFQLRSDLDAVRVQAAESQAQLSELQDVATALAAVRAGGDLETTLWRGEVSWSALLLRLSRVVPPGFSLTSLNAQAAGGAGATIGTVSFSATATNAAEPRIWLQRIAAEEGWANGWLGSVQEADNGDATVNGSFDLTADSITVRGGGPA